MFSRFHKFQAKLALALIFFRHLFLRALFFWRKPGGLPKFLGHFAADAISPISLHEREVFPQLQRCQNCSLCTFSCVAVQNGKAPSGFEPKFLMLGLGRSSHESEYFLEEWLPCAECEACTVVCPNDVPVHEMATVILERRKQLTFRR